MDNILLRKGIQAAKSGHRVQATQFLKQVLRVNPDHEVAWLWLSGVLVTDAEKYQCLQRVLAINPDNQAALRGLATLSVGESPNRKTSDGEVPVVSSSLSTSPASRVDEPSINQTLQGILHELKCLVGEIRALRKELNPAVGSVLKPVETARLGGKTPSMGGEEEKRAEKPIEGVEEGKRAEKPSLLSVTDWLALRHVRVKAYKQPEASDAVFDRLSMFLGERFDHLKKLHALIRRHISTGTRFTLDLSGSSKEEIAYSTQFCTLLHKYAFLSSYKYTKKSKTIHATPQKIGQVINFFTGGWFERFVFLKINVLLSEKGLTFSHLRNAKVSLPNGDDFELDVFFLVGDKPLWIECKTGDYSAYVGKYSDMRKVLSVRIERSIVVVLGISDDLTSELSHLYSITVANEKNFLAKITIIPESEESCEEPSTDIDLSALLKKYGLRPLPEIRSEVIGELIKVANSLVSVPRTVSEIKLQLYENTGVSKNKLQHILNAIVKGKCFLNEEGKPILSFTTPVCRLLSSDIEVIDKKCLMSYAYAIIKVEPFYFDNEYHHVAFENVTGGNVPSAGTREQLKSLIAANS